MCLTLHAVHLVMRDLAPPLFLFLRKKLSVTEMRATMDSGSSAHALISEVSQIFLGRSRRSQVCE